MERLYSERLKGMVLADNSGQYTGEYYWKENSCWFVAEDNQGNPFETREIPIETHDLTNLNNLSVVTVKISG